jgi:hypothetical protein
MLELKTLIDRASNMCGGDRPLAALMGVKPQLISMLRHGRTITPETAAELAFHAHENIAEAVYSAMLERAKGTRREGVLREILGKVIAAGVAVMLGFSYSADSKAASLSSHKSNNLVNSIYIVEYQTIEKYRLFKRWAHAVFCLIGLARFVSGTALSFR